MTVKASHHAPLHTGAGEEFNSLEAEWEEYSAILNTHSNKSKLDCYYGFVEDV